MSASTHDPKYGRSAHANFQAPNATPGREHLPSEEHRPSLIAAAAAAPAAASPSRSGFVQFCDKAGLHWFVAFAMFAIDQMLFAGEAFSGGLLVFLSVFVGLALIIPCTLI